MGSIYEKYIHFQNAHTTPRDGIRRGNLSPRKDRQDCQTVPVLDLKAQPVIRTPAPAVRLRLWAMSPAVRNRISASASTAIQVVTLDWPKP